MGFFDSVKRILLRKNKKNRIKITEISVKKDKNFTDVNKNSISIVKTNKKPLLKKQARKKNKAIKNKISNEINNFHKAADLGDWSLEKFQVDEVEGKVRFHDFNLPLKLMAGICEAGYKYATPIQSMILPHSCKGKDIFGKAQTGTGKTATFAITIFNHLQKNEAEYSELSSPRILILAPTRELVIQIEKDLKLLGKYINFNILSVFGGLNYEKQKNIIENSVIDIIVASPGRLLDYYKQSILNLKNVEILVLDEADRMLDMGFINDIRSIISALAPKEKRQTMFFSATLSEEISKLSYSWTNNPLKFEVESDEITSSNISQYAYIITEKEKLNVTLNIIKERINEKIIIFCNKKEDVAILHRQFKAVGINCGMLTGDISQNKRIRTLESLRNSSIKVLVATDVAARGLHIDDISCVINYTLPEDPEDYVHRIGRTGRAENKGTSYIFATEQDSYYIPKIENYTQKELSYLYPNEELLELDEETETKLKKAHKQFVKLKHSRK